MSGAQPGRLLRLLPVLAAQRILRARSVLANELLEADHADDAVDVLLATVLLALIELPSMLAVRSQEREVGQKALRHGTVHPFGNPINISVQSGFKGRL
jgi:hypothetical protein